MTSPDGLVELSVPAEAMPAGTDLTIELVEAAADLALPDGAENVGPAYDLQPSGLAFSSPATITIRRGEPVDVSAGLPLGLVAIRSEDGQWSVGSNQQITVDEDRLFQSAMISHFSVVTLVDGKVRFSMSPSYAQRDVGQSFEVNAAVTPVGKATFSAEWDWDATEPLSAAGTRQDLSDKQTVVFFCDAVGTGQFTIHLSVFVIDDSADGDDFIRGAVRDELNSDSVSLSGTGLCREPGQDPLARPDDPGVDLEAELDVAFEEALRTENGEFIESAEAGASVLINEARAHIGDTTTFLVSVAEPNVSDSYRFTVFAETAVGGFINFSCETFLGGEGSPTDRNLFLYFPDGTSSVEQEPPTCGAQGQFTMTVPVSCVDGELTVTLVDAADDTLALVLSDELVFELSTGDLNDGSTATYAVDFAELPVCAGR